MRGSRLSIPVKSPEDIRPHLGRGYHWKPGYSAHAVAHSWTAANDIPPPVRTVLEHDNDREPSIVVVEAMLREPFGKLVHEWLNGSPRKTKRLAALCELFRLDQERVSPLRYQLLHRAAAAVYEAKRYRQRTAALIVQSFCPDATGLADFVRFAATLGFDGADRDCMTNGREFDGIVLMLGWVADKLPEVPE